MGRWASLATRACERPLAACLMSSRRGVFADFVGIAFPFVIRVTIRFDSVYYQG